MYATYCGPAPFPGELAASWNLDPVLLAALFALTLILRRDRVGLAGVAVLAIAFVSPLCALSAALFSARVVHHVLLIAVAAPLLALAVPARRPGGIVIPFVASTAVLWAWHIPAAYDAALTNIPLYWVMQISLLGSAVLFWRAVLVGERSPVDRLGFVIAAFAQMGLLGALLTFAPTSLYATHSFAPLAWGMTPLEDQALGGLIMWVPAGIPYAIATVWIARQGWSRLKAARA
ncbi:MAG: cytochrome c oxidase assembly protein [Brevundimonas sp.]|uniref:cytochrome c oxidase assembly protein n=1 Tax=Brevundimonas sp. TaxID=1871086 RepID=UPI00271F2EE7|nr:cytochrome c oxidase assembly protein [Brevundimonas sp.]MDO9609779.1 cytochrome c oxidase assembly protein [Brevundimonas sp.]